MPHVSLRLREQVRAIRRDTLASGYIFHGPPHALPNQAALFFALFTLCPETVPCVDRTVDILCGTCKRLLSYDHPNIRVMTGERSVSVENVREVLGNIQLGSLSRLIILIPQADHLTPQAANALLKTIEEPPPGVTFVLSTDILQHLLPTVRSRCVLISCSPLSHADLQKWLATVVPEAILPAQCTTAVVAHVEKNHVLPELISLKTIAELSLTQCCAVSEQLAKDKLWSKGIVQHWLEEAVLLTPEFPAYGRAVPILTEACKQSYFNLNQRLQLDAVLFQIRGCLG